MDEFFRAQQSPRGDSQVNATLGLVSPSRNPLLPRRFTTDSGRVPTLSTINTIQQQQQQRAPEPQDFAATTAMHKVQLLEKKRQDYERLREQRRRFEAEMHKLDAQTRQEAQELQQMQEDINNRLGGGHQSEPTTPPEYHEVSGLSTIWSSRPNRYSMSSLTSPAALFNRPNRSGSLLTSPQSGGGAIPARLAFDDPLSHSLPGSRRNSDEDDEKEEAVRQDPTSHRSTNALNRYSMPVTKTRTYLSDIGLEDSNNTTRFLFGDEDSNLDDTRTTPTAEAYTNTIFRSQAYSQLTSSGLESETTSTSTWNNLTKHQQRQSMSNMGSIALNGAGSVSSPPSEPGTIGSRPASIRHSLDGMKYLSENVTSPSDTPTSVVSPPPAHAVVSPPKLQQSYSANDVPTMKTNGSGLGANANVHAQQHFHNHNASLGRYPVGAMARHSQNISGDVRVANGHDVGGYASISSTLHANAAPFQAPNQPQSSAMTNPAMSSMTPYSPYYPPTIGFNAGPPINPYAPTNLPMLMQGLNLNNAPPQPQALQPQPLYPTPNYTGYSPQFTQPTPTSRPPLHDSQARVIANRRLQDSEAMSRFQNMTLDKAQGTIHTMAKDQHGCRFLQKQLENRIPAEIKLIFNEVLPHVHELMVDPFGNYLCQKLLEYCNDDERTALIKNSAANMVPIALNQHGTRALQKMIEHVSTEVQVQTIIDALYTDVVTLIQDLNGNHVIQKCLNKLNSANSEFIFKAVGEHCVEVGTHRHGCCVLQRCIDHADGHQKSWLIKCITDNAYQLVQDPFGNYVVQYIIDLNEPTFTEPLVAQFRGHILTLSKHKFSSNVVEKCLRCASEGSKDMIVTELLDAGGEIERFLRDSYANYVYQTALDYASNPMKQRLVDLIRPHLPAIRNTPYGRRISAKISTFDSRGINPNAPPPPPVPSDQTGGQMSLRPAHQRGMSSSTNSTTSTFHGHSHSINGTNGNGNHVAALTYPVPGNGVPGQAPPQPPRGQLPPPQFPPGGPTNMNFF